jgi:hypothetical protein
MVTWPDTLRPEWETTDSPVSAGPDVVVVGPLGVMGLGPPPGVDVVPEGVVPPGPPGPPPDCTTIVPVMAALCRSHWNEYVPGMVKVQLPAQPGPVGMWGKGGTEPLGGPCVWVQEGVAGALVKSTLCMVGIVLLG